MKVIIKLIDLDLEEEHAVSGLLLQHPEGPLIRKRIEAGKSGNENAVIDLDVLLGKTNTENESGKAHSMDLQLLWNALEIIPQQYHWLIRWIEMTVGAFSSEIEEMKDNEIRVFGQQLLIHLRVLILQIAKMATCPKSLSLTMLMLARDSELDERIHIAEFFNQMSEEVKEFDKN